jgi:hypothetical protein
LLTLYVVERWLARLSVSPYRDQFVLKGGMLLAAFDARRPTADADVLALRISNDQATVTAHVVAIAHQPFPDDGVEFRTDTVTSRTIRDDELYAGVRIAMDCAIATAIVRLRLDVNFGDPITPGPRLVELPALRAHEPPVRVLGYPVETVLAEKIATAMTLGPANTRVRDYADIYTIAGSQPIEQAAARKALIETARYRGASIVALSAVVGDLVRLRGSSYAAYRSGLGPDGRHLPAEFDAVVREVVKFADGLAGETDASRRWDHVKRRWDG